MEWGLGEQLRIGTGFGATYSASTVAAPLKKKSVFYIELLFSVEERILLRKKTFENHWHRITSIYRKIRVDG